MIGRLGMTLKVGKSLKVEKASSGKKKEQGKKALLDTNGQREKDGGNEIDELFTKRTVKKVLTSNPASTQPIAASKPSQIKDEPIADTRGTRKRARPLTDDGLPIYTDKEMRIGQGGSTAECPFDCSCCY